MDPTLKSGSTNTLGFNAQKTVGGMRAGPTATRSKMQAGATSRMNALNKK